MTTTVESPVKLPVAEYKGPVEPDWCPGCGDFGVLRALQTGLGELGIHPKDVLVSSGIGCSSNLPGFIHAYGFHGLHGRALPVAQGAKLANPELTVIITGGDGDGYGIGAGHFLHAMRRNIDLTYIVMDNQIYGLTVGQASPTSMRGHKTKSTPWGNLEIPINPIALALVCGATFVARGFSGEAKQLGQIFQQAISHKGFALVDVFSPCVTYNKINTYAWFKERVYKLEDRRHDTSDFKLALETAWQWGNEIPIGLFYQVEQERYEDLDVGLKQGPLVKRKLGMSNVAGRELLREFM
jgi:2-oxoglutarate ferredoxin oxidoreductase subunit beta